MYVPLYNRGVSKGGAGGAIAPPLFATIEDAAGDGDTPHYYLYYYLPPHFKKLLTPLNIIGGKFEFLVQDSFLEYFFLRFGDDKK